MEQQNVENQEQPKDGKSKIDNQFDELTVKLSAILGSNVPTGRKPPKVPNDAVAGIVEKVLKQRTEKLSAELETEVTTLMDEVLSYNGKIEDAEALLKKTIQDEKKALIDKAKKVFDKVQNMDQLKAKYMEGLRAATANVGGGNEAK